MNELRYAAIPSRIVFWLIVAAVQYGSAQDSVTPLGDRRPDKTGFAPPLKQIESPRIFVKSRPKADNVGENTLFAIGSSPTAQ